MKIKVLTLFPGMLEPMLSGSILGRAVENGHLEVNLTNIRDFTLDKHRRTDEQLVAAGVKPEMIRMSIGIEDVNDIIADINQALENSK